MTEGALILGEVAERTTPLEIACDVCENRGRFVMAACCATRPRHSMPELLALLTADLPTTRPAWRIKCMSFSIASGECSWASARMLAVALFGVPGWRPPRRSPGLLPLGTSGTPFRPDRPRR